MNKQRYVEKAVAIIGAGPGLGAAMAEVTHGAYRYQVEAQAPGAGRFRRHVRAAPMNKEP